MRQFLTGMHESTHPDIPPGLNVEGTGKSFPEMGLTIYFKSCFLKVTLTISLRLDADCDPFLWDTVRSLNY